MADEQLEAVSTYPVSEFRVKGFYDLYPDNQKLWGPYLSEIQYIRGEVDQKDLSVASTKAFSVASANLSSFWVDKDKILENAEIFCMQYAGANLGQQIISTIELNAHFRNSGLKDGVSHFQHMLDHYRLESRSASWFESFFVGIEQTIPNFGKFVGLDFKRAVSLLAYGEAQFVPLGMYSGGGRLFIPSAKLRIKFDPISIGYFSTPSKLFELMTESDGLFYSYQRFLT
jgi:hypothetical protein